MANMETFEPNFFYCLLSNSFICVKVIFIDITISPIYDFFIKGILKELVMIRFKREMSDSLDEENVLS